MIGVIFYWFSDDKNQEIILDKEKIILPRYDKSIYKNIPDVREYIDDVKEILAKDKGVLPLDSNELDNKAKIVQDLILKDKEFLSDIRDSSGKLQHNDIMTIRPAIISTMDKKIQDICKNNTCYQAIKYNFVTDTTTRAIIDTDNNKILQIDRFSSKQPDISQRLKKIAQKIALYSPEVKEILKDTPQLKDMSMANVRASFNGSPCENKNHLCVAPTFSYHKEQKALWAIIDLTDMKLAIAKWAGLGKTTTPSCIDERALQNRYIMENFCQKNSYYEDIGWRLKYRITGSDGLEIVDASFNGKNILKSAKIVDWHVAYRGIGEVDSSRESYVAGRRVEYVKGKSSNFFFGYNDAMGCPMFSTSVVLSFNAPQIRDIIKDGRKVGFYITQDFRNPKWPMACNYRYENRFEFYFDGSFRVVGVNKGRGCGDNAIYRPVMRIDLFSGDEEFYKYEDKNWKMWLYERKDFQYMAKEYYMGRYLYKITTKDIGYYIEPNRGQFKDKSRGDNATLFVTLYKEDEGAKDLLTLGSCCKLDEDGVEEFINGEKINNRDIVIWYVPRVQNDSREGQEYCWADTRLENGNLVVKEFPCIVGAKFVPIKSYK
jgi:hypothetical protein